MMLDVITSSSFEVVAEVLSAMIETIIEILIAAKVVFIERKSFAQLANFLQKILPLLEELKRQNFSSHDGLSNAIMLLNQEVKVAKQLTEECSQKNKVYLLVNTRSIAKRLENTTKEISRALGLIPLTSLNLSFGITAEIRQLLDHMQTAEFKAAIEQEEILEKIESGIQERNADRSYVNNLLFSIAEALGISTEPSALKKEFEEFKREAENAKLRKDQAEAIQMDQIISLLERADATSSPNEREVRYIAKRDSLGNQPLDPLHSFICPITKEVMVDPVEISSGHTFERSAIGKWFADGNNLCPLTMVTLDTSILRPNKTLRQSIEEWKDRNIMILIASMKRKLPSEEEEEVLHCLEQLQDLCQQKDTHREWVVLENYIPILVELLGSKNRDIKNNSLIVLCILAKHSDEAKERIAKADNAIGSIVRSLGRRVAEAKLAVALLLELSKSESVRDCIGKAQGCILLLVTMTSNDDSQAARDAKELLENLTFSTQNVIQMAKANYFKHLLQSLSSGPEDEKLLMATTVADMELTDHNKSSLLRDGILGSLLNLLTEGDAEIRKVAVKALQNLASLPKNGLEMIRGGVVVPLLDILCTHTSPPTLREQVAATFVHLAISTRSQDSSTTPVSLLEADEQICGMFLLVNLTWPPVQQSILRAFHAMCHSPFATTIKAKLIQFSAVQLLVTLCEADNLGVRANAVKLLYCLIEDDNETTVLEHQNSIETLLKIIKTSNDDEEIASALGIISKLPKSPQFTERLLNAEALPVIFKFIRISKHNGSRNDQLIESAVGATFHFSDPTNQQLQRQMVEIGVIPVLVQLLELGTSLTKRQAAILLAQFSKISDTLCRPSPKRHGFCCFSSPPETVCPVHQVTCTEESCLLEAGAVEPLVKVLGEPDDPGACEAALEALSTLIEGPKLQSGSKVLAEARAMPSIIRLLDTPSSTLQQKVLISLERIFRQVDFKQKYGPSAQMPLVDLTQRGNNTTKPLAARILAHLNVLQEQSSYF
ncbi:U-box domain-containing protein 44-like [Diospyros lotus]|uniref:U-box domain-containing protein 44-like n=1 Tax=Diospyros lotus TaxID=55363 RepID=UPI002255C386|nr:U-box domain-containing protein 44-like [Diospyros lotus]XP_052211527.1 U-box domain-containing protein 44-like [Diospyros lotus]XP_052211528.1 U-box domain-containing protein 44-like [Diospyros lotus]